MRVLQGIAASPGFAVAPLHRIVKQAPVVVRRELDPEELAGEERRFGEAVAAAKAEIQALAEKVEQDLGPEDSAILSSQLLILEDELTWDSTLRRIRERRLNAEAAFTAAVADVIHDFGDLQAGYFQERILDLRDVEERVLRHLTGIGPAEIDLPAADSVVAAANLTPTDTAAIGSDNVAAFLLAEGSRTSHVAILARSLGVPAVVGLGAALAEVPAGAIVAVDGAGGRVHVDPDPATLAGFEALVREQHHISQKLAHLRGLPAESPDGRRVKLCANVELPLEVDKALAFGAEGIGLLRTEYIYFQHRDIPGEEEQVRVYTDFIHRMAGRPVLFRTLDVGGDKVKRFLGARREFNPFLGWRGIRFLLANRPLFKTQLRAIYRAAAAGPSRLMFPMITGVEELREARALCRECCEELAAEGLEHDPGIEVGIMIETPSAALVADALARECDFFSVGTNDLIQYTLAMDRSNNRVAYLYQPLHPALLRSLRSVIEAAHDAGIWVGICGEMASETRYAEVLLGLGFDEISLHAPQLPKVKQVIRWTTVDEARDLLARLLDGDSAAANDALLTEYIDARKRSREDAAGDGEEGP